MRSSNTSRNPSGYLVLIALAFCFANSAFAIDPHRAMSQYLHDRWGSERGFPRGPVYAITQTPDGYLWIGTDAGLVRFDGLNFRLVQDESSANPMGPVFGLVADHDANLWLRMNGPSMLRYHDGKFEKPVYNLEHPPTIITAICLSAHGGPLISMMERGSLAFHGDRFDMLETAHALPRSPVLAMAQTADGDIWIGTRDAGLIRQRNGETIRVTRGLPDLKVNSLVPDGDRNLWVGTDNGIVRWNGQELTDSGIPRSFNNFQALAIAKDRDQNLWIGTNSRGLLRFNSQGVSFLDDSERGSAEAVTALFEDREGSLWIGSASGLERLRDSAFVTYSSPEGVPSDGSNPIFVDSENRVWFAPADGGLWWLKDGTHGSVAQASLRGDVVYSIAGNHGELWLGRKRGGLTHLRSEGGTFTAETFTRSSGLAEDNVYSVYQARDGTVWAGTLSGGVSRLRNGTFTTYTTAQGLASNTVSAILESSEGTTWFATPSGLSALSGGNWKTYTVKDGLLSVNVNCLFEDHAGVLWIGTAGGLAFRRNGRIQAPTGVPASMREQILGIAEDGFGSLWMATSNHVLRVNLDKLLRGTLTDGDLREYGIADGLRGVEGVKRQRSVVKDSIGRIWFSLNHGISVVDPGRLTRSLAPALVHVQTLVADGVEIPLRGVVHVPGGKQRITLGFAGLDLAVPERVRFRYILEGYDRDWNGPVGRQEAIYTNLGPKPYRFRVIASNADGAWNSPEAVIAFEIDPTFWQTIWFRLGLVAACFLFAVAAYRIRLHQLTRQMNVRFEERLTERTHIAQELHDTLLQGFLSASMQLHMAVDSLSEDAPAKPSFNRILELMRRVIEEGRNAVRGLRSSAGNSLDLEQAFSRIQQELGGPETVAFRVVVQGRPRPLNPMIRDEIYRIGREGLVNAFRHSGGKNIEVELEYAANQLRVVVRDNGRGIDPQVVQAGREGHWGLPGMRERAERIGGAIHVWSSPSAGTEVELSVPSQVAFQDHSSNVVFRWLATLQRGAEPKPGPDHDRKPTMRGK